MAQAPDSGQICKPLKQMKVHKICQIISLPYSHSPIHSIRIFQIVQPNSDINRMKLSIEKLPKNSSSAKNHLNFIDMWSDIIQQRIGVFHYHCSVHDMG